MDTPENQPGKSLLLLGRGDQFMSDMQHVTTSLEFAKVAGHQVRFNSFWANGHIGMPVIVEAEAGSDVNVGSMTEAAAMTAADIEITRRETLPDGLLSFRERRMKQVFLGSSLELSGETIRRGFAEVILRMGGVAVIAGNNLALQATAGYYEDLRQLNRE